MNKINVGDILYYQEYLFTDDGTTSKHFALAVLGPTVFENSIHCAVITSNQSKNIFGLKLDHRNYRCFNKPTSVCFDRIDIEHIEERNNFIRGTLLLADIRKGLKIICKCIAKSQKC